MSATNSQDAFIDGERHRGILFKIAGRSLSSALYLLEALRRFETEA